MLDLSFLATSQFYYNSFGTNAGRFTTFITWLRRFARVANTLSFSTYRAGRRGYELALAGILATLFAWFFCKGFAIPLGIRKVLIGIHKIVDGEELFPVEQARSATDNLLELNN